MDESEIRESLGMSELKKRRGSRNKDSDSKHVVNLGSVNLFESRTKDSSRLSLGSIPKCKQDVSHLKSMSKPIDESNH